MKNISKCKIIIVMIFVIAMIVGMIMFYKISSEKQEEWNQISIGNYNSKLTSKVTFD